MLKIIAHVDMGDKLAAPTLQSVLPRRPPAWSGGTQKATGCTKSSHIPVRYYFLFISVLPPGPPGPLIFKTTPILNGLGINLGGGRRYLTSVPEAG